MNSHCLQDTACCGFKIYVFYSLTHLNIKALRSTKFGSLFYLFFLRKEKVRFFKNNQSDKIWLHSRP